MVIILDAGHYYKANPSPVNKDYYEGNMSFKLAGFLKSELEKYGAKVYLTRNSINENPTLEQRGKLSGIYKADLFISLHSNATGTTNYAPNGVDVIYSLKNKAWNKQFAEKLLDVICKATGFKKRSAWTRLYPGTTNTDYYGVIRSSAASGCTKAFLIEHGFHSNVEDTAKLLKDETLTAIAKAEALLIAEEFNLSSSNTGSINELYRVRTSWSDIKSQRGAFSVLENAKRCADSNQGTFVFDSKGNVVYPMGVLWLGKSLLTKEKCIKALKKYNPNYSSSIVSKYYQLAEKYGIRADLAFCQACVETGWFKFKGTVKIGQNNFCGLGCTSTTNPGATFNSMSSGVEAHLQHIYAYCSTEPLPEGVTLIDPRFNYVVPRGKGTTVESFNGTWAGSSTYSDSILSVFNTISNI